MATAVDIISGAARAKRAEAAERERTRLRARANSLLASPDFVDWIGELMVKYGFFGEGRELTPYMQGKRGGVVEEIERVLEFSDNGDRILGEVFRTRIVGSAHGGK